MATINNQDIMIKCQFLKVHYTIWLYLVSSTWPIQATGKWCYFKIVVILLIGSQKTYLWMIHKLKKTHRMFVVMLQ